MARCDRSCAFGIGVHHGKRVETVLFMIINEVFSKLSAFFT
ncbi:hypothetical protein [Bartonella sp. AR 15-3]|nr:hypothetical protein [Bartonella sp. AR 15-3]